VTIVHDPHFRAPSPRPSPRWGEGEESRRSPRVTRIRYALNLLRRRHSRLPLPSGERDGVRGLWRFKTVTAAAAAMLGILTSTSEAELVPYKIVGDAIPASLTGSQGDAVRGRAIVANHNTGLCLLCHSGPFPEDKFQGTMAPDLAGAGVRWSEGQLRLRIVDASKFNAATIMPPFYRVDHLTRVAPAFRDKPVLSAVDVEDVVAYLMTLK
jgi:L-cysteine S-thiosulfotransferase